MSAENTSSAPAAAAPVQGASPVPHIETRGQTDFTKQLETAETVTTQPVKKEGVQETAPAQETQVAKPAEATSAAPTTPKPGIDPEMVRSIVEATAAGLEKKNAPQGRQPDRELTAQEFIAKYGIPQVDAKVMQAILDADPAKGAAAMQNLLLQAVRAGALISKDVYSADIQKFRSEVDPHISEFKSFQQQRAEEAAVKAFYSEYKDLVGEEALVEEMTAALNARVISGQMKPFATQAEANKAVADAARKLVARMNKPGAGQGAAQPATPPTRQMSAALSAGRSGTGQPATKSVAEEVFGADAR